MNMRFKERDRESRFYYYGARYYAGWLCRFVSVDALKDDYPELTTFQYASNNPITNIDLDGLEGIDALDYFSRYKPAAARAKYEAEKKREYKTTTPLEDQPKSRSARNENITSEVSGYSQNDSRTIDGPILSLPMPKEFYKIKSEDFFSMSNYLKSSQSDINYAQRLIDEDKVTFATLHVSGVNDKASAKENMIDAAAGDSVNRSSYGTAPGGRVELNPKLLSGLYKLSQKFNFSVSELAGASHSKNSKHYEGIAADINYINGMHVSSEHPKWELFKKEAIKLGFKFLGPGDPGHSKHIHLTMPRKEN